MTSVADEVQGAIVARLRGSKTIMKAIGGHISDEAPAAFPSSWVGVTTTDVSPEESDAFVTVHLWLPLTGADPKKIESTADTVLQKPPIFDRKASVSWQAVHSEIRFDDELLACRVLLRFHGIFRYCAGLTSTGTST